MAKNDFENINILPGGDQLIPAPINNEILPSEESFTTGLPPNTNGGAVENAIDAATLGRFVSDGQQGVSQDDFDFVNRQVDPLGGQPAAIADATNELFSPGINRPIRVGGTSGQLTGNRDIFVAQGGVRPFAALERRKAAQQQSALKRKKDLDRFKVTLPKLSKDPRFNDNILKAHGNFREEFVARAKREFGDNWVTALTAPETKIGRDFIQGNANFDLLAGKIDQIVDLQGEIESSIEEGDQFVSDATLQLHQNFKTLSGEFSQEGGNLASADLGGMLDMLQTSQTLDQFIKDNDILSNVEGEVLQRAGIDDSRADQFRQTTRFTKDFQEGLRTQAKRIKGNVAFRGRQDLTEDAVFQILRNLKGKVDKRTATVKSKPRSAGGFSEDPKDIDDRVRNIETIQKAFFKPDGTIGDEISDDAQKIVRTLVGSEVPGKGKVTDTEFVKGTGGQGDHIKMTVSSGTGRSAKKDVVEIDLTDPGSFVELNGLLNTSKSENLKIKNESFRGQERRTDLPDVPTNVIQVTQEQLDERVRSLTSRGNRVTEEDVIKLIEAQGKTIEIK